MLASAFSLLSELPVPGVCDLAGARRKEGRICWRFPVLPRVLMHAAALALRWVLQRCQKWGLRPRQEGWFRVTLSTLPVRLGQGALSQEQRCCLRTAVMERRPREVSFGFFSGFWLKAQRMTRLSAGPSWPPPSPAVGLLSASADGSAWLMLCAQHGLCLYAPALRIVLSGSWVCYQLPCGTKCRSNQEVPEKHFIRVQG